jgi:hypothetical protein
VQRAKGDLQVANASLIDALPIARDLGDALGQANLMTELAFVQRLLGDHPAARASVDEALARARAIGDSVGQAEALNCLGGILSELTDTQASTISGWRWIRLATFRVRGGGACTRRHGPVPAADRWRC